jgi:hypothetical protein
MWERTPGTEELDLEPSVIETLNRMNDENVAYFAAKLILAPQYEAEFAKYGWSFGWNTLPLGPNAIYENEVRTQAALDWAIKRVGMPKIQEKVQLRRSQLESGGGLRYDFLAKGNFCAWTRADLINWGILRGLRWRGASPQTINTPTPQEQCEEVKREFLKHARPGAIAPDCSKPQNPGLKVPTLNDLGIPYLGPGSGSEPGGPPR